jgi:hypothetical protein
MIDTRVLDTNDTLGYQKLFHFDDVTGEITIETQFEVEAEKSKLLYNSFDERTRWGDVNLVAQIPLSIYFDLKAKGIVDDEVRLRKWLDDRDNLVFRTRPGKLSR